MRRIVRAMIAHPELVAKIYHSGKAPPLRKLELMLANAPLDAAAAKTQKGLRIFVRDTRSLESIAKRLQMPEAGQGSPARGPQPKPVAAVPGGADGDVSLVLMLDLETEVEMKLPGRFRVSPQIAGAIKAVSGVVDVQTL